jgi:ACS family hexuronate transporter-like MFS transporter
VADRLGTRRAFALFVGVWSAAAMLHGTARGKWSLGGFRFLLGLGEPGNFPCASKAVAEWFPAGQRALGTGIFNAGSTMGSALAPPVVAYLTLHYNWRYAFLFTGSLGLVWLAAWLILYQPPHKNRFLSRREYDRLKERIRPPEETTAAGRGAGWMAVLRMRQCYTIVLARFFTDPVAYFVIFWLPEYLRRERGYDMAMVGAYAWIPFIFGDLGYVVGGWLSGYLIRRGMALPTARKLVMSAGAACLPVAIFAPMLPTAGMAIAAICSVMFGHAFFVANLQTLPTDLFPGQQIGSAIGFSGAGGAVGGIVANLLTGYFVQHISYRPVFAAAGLMHPLACLLVWRLLPNRYFREKA